jgi:MFS family permease
MAITAHSQSIHADPPGTEHISPRIKNIFHGWWMVAGAIICQFVFLSVSQASVGVSLLPACNDLGWPAWQFTLGPSLAVLVGVISGPAVGKYIDRHGPRIPMLVGATVSVLGLYGLSTQATVWSYWMLYSVCGLVGWSFFGPQIVNPVLTKWFVAKRGWALAVGSVGISLGGMVTPIVMIPLVDAFGWRTGYVALSVFALLVIPVSFIMKRTPEDHGWFPDGHTDSLLHSNETERSLTRPEAVRTVSFWLLVFGLGLNTMALITVLVHSIPFVTKSGFSRITAAFAVSFIGIGNLSSKVVWARALQSVQPKILVLAQYASSIVGLICTLHAASTGAQSYMIVGFFLFGFGFGGTIPLSESLWAVYFGRQHIGAIRGISYPISAIGSSIGPVLVGLWFDYSQSYTAAFVALGVAYACAALLVGLSRSPNRNLAST